MWIDRVSHGSIFHLARHIKLYQAGFIAIAVVSLGYVFLSNTANSTGLSRSCPSLRYLSVVYLLCPLTQLNHDDRVSYPSGVRSGCYTCCLPFSTALLLAFGWPALQALFTDMRSPLGHSLLACRSQRLCLFFSLQSRASFVVSTLGKDSHTSVSTRILILRSISSNLIQCVYKRP